MIMTINQYLTLIAMLLLGQALHFLLVKLPSVKAKAAANNKVFSFKEYWKSDWNLIVGTWVGGAMLVLGLDQIFKWKPETIDTIKWLFAGFGGFGSSIVMAKGSEYERNLMKVLSIKANVSDAVTGGTQTVEETITKGSAATGEDISQPASK